MWSVKDMRTLGAAIAQIVPGEGSTHPLAAGVGRFVNERFEDDPPTREIVRAGLILLQARDFVYLFPAEQDEAFVNLKLTPPSPS